MYMIFQQFARITDGLAGVRIPLFIISPFSRGGRVFTEHSDHTSQILFVGRSRGLTGCILTSCNVKGAN